MVRITPASGRKAALYWTTKTHVAMYGFPPALPGEGRSVTHTRTHIAYTMNTNDIATSDSRMQTVGKKERDANVCDMHETERKTRPLR